MSDLAEKSSGPNPAPSGETCAPASRPRGRISAVIKLTLLAGLTLTLLLSVLLTAGWFYFSKVRQNQVQAHLNSVATSRREMVRAQLDLLRQRVELNTDRGEFRAFFFELTTGTPTPENRANSQESLDRLAHQKTISTASLVNEAGTIVLSTDPAQVGRDVSKWPEIKPGLIGPHVGQPQAIKDRFEAVLAAPVRTRRDAGRTYGVLLLIADVSELARAIRDTTGLGQTGEVILGTREGERLRFFFPPRNAPEITDVPLPASPSLRGATAGEEPFFYSRDYRGRRVIATGRSIGYGGWALTAKMDKSEAYAPLTRGLRFSILTGALIVAAGLLAAYLMAARFLRPVRQLAEAAGRVAGGDYETKVPVTSSDEFGVLTTNFNEMTAALRARRGERDEAEAALREADRRKDEFLAVLGHELRNPLSAMVHSVDVIEASADDPHADVAAREVLARQTKHLTRLVDDLLDVARISEGKIELRKQPVEIGDALLRTIEAIRPLIDERRHSLDLVLASGGKLWIEADPARLDQIITNLLHNAAKYTPDGGRITVTERQEGSDAVIIIRDTGIGIAPDMLARIFELFTQADRSLEHRTGGLGVGLSLCRQFVAMHGGTIAVQSSGPGRGATFTLRFPIIAAPAPVGPPAPVKRRPAGARRRVLLVDDNLDTVHSMSRLLKMRGHEVATAVDGLAALKVAREFQPDFILLDIGLPSLDGYSVARRLRAEGFTDTPIVAVSGYAQQSDRERSREAGFNRHFAKPVDFEAIAELILADQISAD